MVSSLSRRTVLLGLTIGVAAIGDSAAFVTTSGPPLRTMATKAFMATTESNSKTNGNDMETSLARKQVLQTLGFTGLGWALSGSIHSTANAAEDGTSSELESTSTTSGSATTLIESSNIRSLKRAEKQLGKMELYAVENDYEAIKQAIRNAPFSEIRKNSFALIKEYASQPDLQSKLTASYQVFISSLETMDSTASLGMRGRKLDNGALLKSYQATSVALNEWIAVASAVFESS
jgi:hypothetical protein